MRETKLRVPREKQVTETLSIRLTPSQKDQLTRVAHEHYRTTSNHLRWLVATHLEAEAKKASGC